MRLSVVVPTLDEGARVQSTLRPLQPWRVAGHEIIVIDGGSADDTVAVAQPLADRVLQAPRGRAAQMNVGAALASGDVLLFLHADCRLPANTVDAITTVTKDRRWGRFDVALEGRSPLLPIVSAMMNARSRATGIATGDQGIFVDRALFRQAGGFPRIALMEDVALSRALLRIAGRPACLSGRVVASGRRWDEHGALRTIATMWSLRFDHWRGTDPAVLARRYRSRPARPAPTLIVFARDPRPGHAKRRLGATIGDAAAAKLYRELVERTLAIASAARALGIVHAIELWGDPDATSDAFREWAERFDVALFAQSGDDLGERMRHALEHALANGRPALLIGTDCPVLDVAYLGSAAAALSDHDAVIGPAEDGGYVLIGLARPLDVFDDIPWGTADVLTATRNRLARRGARWRKLTPLWDVDVERDLVRLRALGAAAWPKVIAPAA